MAIEQNKLQEPRWKPFVGREVEFTTSDRTIFGLLNQPNIEGRYADFLPYWSIEADGKVVRIETEVPFRVDLYILEKVVGMYESFPNGYMAAKAKRLNDSLNFDKKPMGFSV